MCIGWGILKFVSFTNRIIERDNFFTLGDFSSRIIRFNHKANTLHPVVHADEPAVSLLSSKSYRHRSASLYSLYKTMRPLSLVQGTELTGNSLFPSHISSDLPVQPDSYVANINTVLLGGRGGSRSRLRFKYFQGCKRIFQFHEWSLKKDIYNRTWKPLGYLLRNSRNFYNDLAVRRNFTADDRN